MYEFTFANRVPRSGLNVKLAFGGKFGEVSVKGDTLSVSLGDKKSFIPRKARSIATSVLSYARTLKAKTVVFDLRKTPLDEYAVNNLVYSLVVASESAKEVISDLFDKEDKEEKSYPSKVVVVHNSEQKVPLTYAAVIGESVNFTRRVNNLPSNVATPLVLAGIARDLAKHDGLKYKVLMEEDMEKLGMNALLAVARGSANPPAMPILEYKHPKAKKTVVVVGKGITFDSGGISLKPSKNMDEMKFDKSGAMAVLGIMHAVSVFKPPVNVIGVMPMAENMPGGNATKPGDIVKAYNGKTIEILNTDAEGRLILADAIAYAEDKYKPDYIIDMATLTGACVVALGSYASGIMGNDEEFISKFVNYSKVGFEEVWPLPLWDEYKEMMKSKIADLKNISGTYEAGAITAGAFLSNFVDKAKWVHIDIAGTAWRTRSIPPVDLGATGAGVPIVVDVILDLGTS